MSSSSGQQQQQQQKSVHPASLVDITYANSTRLCSVWQQNRSNTFRNANSRTPQNSHSNAASPQPPKPDSSHPPPRNVWASRPRERAASGGISSAQNQTSSFSIDDAKAVLCCRRTTASPYKPAGATTSNKAAAGAGAAKMANGQPFFANLAKQVADLEAGG